MGIYENPQSEFKQNRADGLTNERIGEKYGISHFYDFFDFLFSRHKKRRSKWNAPHKKRMKTTAAQSPRLR